MPENIAIKVEDVSKTFKLPLERAGTIKSLLIGFAKRKRGYELQEALRNVSFEIKKGEFFGIVGRNGSGKSTLLKMLAGIYTPTSGSIQVNGKLTPFIELGVGFSPELTGRENVFLNGALLGFNRTEMEAMYDDIVAFAELERFMDQKLKNYSSGMQVRLAFSIAIRAKGEILLLDEVLAVGDAAFQQKCYDYFEELKREKRTVVFVSHDMGAVKRFCSRAIYIKNGVLIEEGDPVSISDTYVQENIAPSHQKSDETQVVNSKYSIKVELIKQTNKSATFSIKYKAEDDTKMYVGISIVRDGVSVAELSTSLEKPLTGKSELIYSLDTSIFNAGTYVVDAALFKLENRELLAAVYRKKAQFAIKGYDVTKGAALNLEDTWEYK